LDSRAAGFSQAPPRKLRVAHAWLIAFRVAAPIALRRRGRGAHRETDLPPRSGIR